MQCANCSTNTSHLYRMWDGDKWLLLCVECYCSVVTPTPWHDVVIRGDVPAHE